MTRHRIARLVITLLSMAGVLDCWGSGPAYGAAPCAAVPQSKGKPNRQESNHVYEEIVESLVNSNEEPTITGKGQKRAIYFSTNYNWREQERVCKAIEQLSENIDLAWPALIEHLDDRRYCVTSRGYRISSIHNATVGLVCGGLVYDGITAAYWDHIPDGASVLKMPIPEVKFRAWCHEQLLKRRPLYDIQIEACEWALTKVPGLEDVTPDDKREMIAHIRRQVKTLRESKRPILGTPYFRNKSHVTSSASEAAMLRTLYERNRNNK